MKVGDLVCYNAAGQRKKTLGLVLEMGVDRNALYEEKRIVLIQWCMVGEMMPRRGIMLQPNGTHKYDKPVSGELVWHKFGDWFEVINECR